MPDFITLTCPTCGGKLQITNSIDHFACGHCGNEHIVRREGGIVYLAPLVEGIQQIRTGVDKTAAELAVIRLPKDIAALEQQIREAKARTLELPELPELLPWWDLVLHLAFYVLIVPTIAFLVFLLSGAHPGLVLAAWGVSVLFGAWYPFHRRGREKKRIHAERQATAAQRQAILDQRQTAITELESKLESKRTQLQTNRQILDG